MPPDLDRFSAIRKGLLEYLVLKIVAGEKVYAADILAKLRDTALEPQDFLLKTEMSAGHGGVSGRYNAWRDRAFSYAWVLDVVGRSGIGGAVPDSS